METIDRRGLMRGMLFAAAATAGGVTLASSAAHAMPMDPRASVPGPEAEKARVVVVAPRRRRRWVCWWHRGRRVCGWR